MASRLPSSSAHMNKAIKPFLSTNRLESKRRVINLYRAWIRFGERIPYVYDVPVTTEVCWRENSPCLPCPKKYRGMPGREFPTFTMSRKLPRYAREREFPTYTMSRKLARYAGNAKYRCFHRGLTFPSLDDFHISRSLSEFCLNT